MSPASGAPSTPEPSVSPPAPSPTAIAARWQQIGTATGGDVVGFGAGYVALGGTSDVESSVDGRAWSPARLPFKTSKDPTGIRLAAQAAAIATDGHEVVVVGGYTHGPCRPAGGAVGGGPECPSSPISWVTSDGRTWTSSFPWHGPDAPKGYWQGNAFSTVWTVPTGGFDAAVMNVAGEAGVAGDIFHSDDGLAWTPLPATPPKKLAGAPNPTELWDVGQADATGRRLVASYWYLAGGDSVARLFSSPDGGSWTSLDGFPGQGVVVGSAVAPDPALASVWIVAGQDASSYASGLDVARPRDLDGAPSPDGHRRLPRDGSPTSSRRRWATSRWPSSPMGRMGPPTTRRGSARTGRTGPRSRRSAAPTVRGPMS